MSDKFEDYTRLVHSISNRFCHKRENLDDITQEGFVGLTKAINTFDDTQGTKFITYAFRCISNEIMKYLRVESRQPRTIDGVVLDSLFAAPIEHPDDGEEYCLTEEESKIVELRKSKFTNKEVCNLVGCNQEQMLKKMTILRKKIRK